MHYRDYFHVSQQKYVRDLLERAHMTNAKSINTPIINSPTLTSLVGSPLPNGTLYRQVVGSLKNLCGQVADVLTKPLTIGTFTRCKECMNAISASSFLKNSKGEMLDKQLHN